MDKPPPFDWPWKSHETYITPYLPQEAQVDAQAWRNEGKVVVQFVPPVRPGTRCENCQDHGAVYLELMGSGPIRFHPGGKCTYLERSEKHGEGWYRIRELKAYPCPHCKGQTIIPPKPVQKREMPEIDELAQNMNAGRFWEEDI